MTEHNRTKTTTLKVDRKWKNGRMPEPTSRNNEVSLKGRPELDFFSFSLEALITKNNCPALTYMYTFITFKEQNVKFANPCEEIFPESHRKHTNEDKRLKHKGVYSYETDSNGKHLFEQFKGCVFLYQKLENKDP